MKKFEITEQAVRALDLIANECTNGKTARQIDSVLRSLKEIEEIEDKTEEVNE